MPESHGLTLEKVRACSGPGPRAGLILAGWVLREQAVSQESWRSTACVRAKAYKVKSLIVLDAAQEAQVSAAKT